jgi:hypothetical protein
MPSLVQIGQPIHSSDANLPLHSRAPGFSPPPEFLLPWRPWRGAEILTSIEIAGLWHLPAPGLGMHVRWLPCKIIPPPPHAFILPERIDRIMLGRAKRADGTIGKDQVLGQIMAIFARLDPATWGKAPAMKEFLQMASLLVLECEQRPTLAHVKQCLLDEGYRETLIPFCTNPDVLTFWTVTFPAQGEQQRTSLQALLRRFSQLLTTETTRYIVSQPSSRLNLLDAIEEGKIILVPLPHVTLGDIASAAGMLILQKFVRAAFSRPGNDQSRSRWVRPMRCAGSSWRPSGDGARSAASAWRPASLAGRCKQAPRSSRAPATTSPRTSARCRSSRRLPMWASTRPPAPPGR